MITKIYNKSIYFILFSLLIFVIGEVLTSFCFPQELHYLRENRYTISENIPGFKGGLFSKEFNTSFKFNKAGQRGRAVSYEKPEGARRVLFLGDSFLASLQVNYEDFFVPQTEQKLNGLSQMPYEVMAMGVGGWDNVQQLIYLKNEGVKYNIDDVVVFLYTGNDINGNYGRWYDENLSQYIDREDLNLFYRNSEKTNPIKLVKELLLQQSHFINLIYKATASSKFREDLRKFSRKIGVIEIPEREQRKVDLSREEKREKSWQLTFDLMDKFKEYCQAKGINLHYVLIPDNTQVYPEHFKERFKKIQDKYWGIPKAQTRIINALEERKIKYLDLLPVFTKEASRIPSLLYFKENEHWTPEGHQLVSNTIKDYFLS